MKQRYFETLWLNAQNPQVTQRELAVLLSSPDVDVHPGPFLDLGNTQLGVRAAGENDREGAVAAISFHSADVTAGDGSRGLELLAADSTPKNVRAINPDEVGIQAIDHVVLQTNDADDCIRLFQGQLGMRLALDQTVEKWGGRMLFFREGALTLEVIHNFEKPIKKDRFWGICYRCARIEDTVKFLSQQGVACSEIRAGRKEGTQVATIKSHCANIPSLLIA